MLTNKMVVMAFINWFKPVTVYVTNYDLYFNQFLSFDYIFFVSKSLGAIQSYSFLHLFYLCKQIALTG